MTATWQWEHASRTYGNFGNANQWTVNAGLHSLAREATQNSNDARTSDRATLEFEFIRLTGERRAAFEKAAAFDQLHPHLAAMGASAASAVTAGQVKAGAEELQRQDGLLLLRVSDYGCRGLTGPEFPENGVDESEYGNLIKLCRLDLFSGKDEAAGGSFGLGKAVYWRFSRIQTVLFSSVLAEEDAVDGRTGPRVLGVNQGVLHTLDGEGYVGRGYFGEPDPQGDVASVWEPADLEALALSRSDTRPGTTATIIGFYDPDSPEKGVQGGTGLIALARELRAGVEENFWPLITRGRMSVRISVVDDGHRIHDEIVDPRETYTELVRALERYDRGEADGELGETYSTAVRDIPIRISQRVDDAPHDAFVHTAKLVVTISDEQKDDLENRVCLLRKPEMLVQTIPKEFEGHTFHAFLLAGVAVNPRDPTEEDRRADDFLRFAEPPAHDRWIPGKGRYQSSQGNLTARYRAPWLPNLREIETEVLKQLFELFDTSPPPDDRGPESVFKHLRFLTADPGSGGSGSSAPRKPAVDLTDWRVENGRWHVTFEVTTKNDDQGWTLRPDLKLIGLDGKGVTVPWGELEAVEGGAVDGRSVYIPTRPRVRKLSATFRGISTADLPIPAESSVIDVQIGQYATGRGL